MGANLRVGAVDGDRRRVGPVRHLSRPVATPATPALRSTLFASSLSRENSHPGNRRLIQRRARPRHPSQHSLKAACSTTMWFHRSQARYLAIVQAVAAAGTLAILATPASAFSLAPTSALQSLRTTSCGAATGRGSRIARVHRQRNAPGANVLGLHANGSEEQGSGDMVEKVKAEAQDALSFVGWADERESGEDTGPVIRREDIPEMVARAVAAEEFADERSREMFEQDTFDKLLKEVVRQEIKADYGVELENLLNPIKVVSLNKKIIEAEKALAGDIDSAGTQPLLPVSLCLPAYFIV